MVNSITTVTAVLNNLYTTTPKSGDPEALIAELRALPAAVEAEEKKMDTAQTEFGLDTRRVFSIYRDILHRSHALSDKAPGSAPFSVSSPAPYTRTSGHYTHVDFTSGAIIEVSAEDRGAFVTAMGY